MLKVEQLKPQDYLLSVIDLSFREWNFFFYNEFASVFISSSNAIDKEVVSTIAPFLEKLNEDFRIQLNIKSVPFLVAFFQDSKEVRFYTPKLSQELFILQNKEILDIDDAVVKKLREHTEKVYSQSLKNFPSVIETIIKKNELDNFYSSEQSQLIEQRTSAITKDLLLKINEYRPSLFEKISDYGLGLTAQYALLRVHLLKFLAILPSLDHDQSGAEVKRILLEALLRFLKDNKKARNLKKRGQERALPSSHILGIRILFLLSSMLPPFLLATLVRKSVKLMAKRFIAGESIEKADKSLSTLAQTQRDVTLDQLGELVVSEKEADHYMNEVLKLIRGFSLHVRKGELNRAGVNRAHVSIKVSALCSDFKPHAFDYTYDLVAPRLKEILLVAKAEDVFINIDAEHYHFRDVVFKIYRKVLLSTPELFDFKSTGIVVQAYLRDGSSHLDEILSLAMQRNIVMPVRLVKGAYWDAETVEGDAHSFDAPQFLNKEETDIHFRLLILKILKNNGFLKLAIASHNFSDHAFSEAAKEVLFPESGEIEHQCLHMTYEALSTALAKMNWATRNYVPVGSLLVGMAYLVRRIMENSSQVGVLTIMRSHKKQLNLISPHKIHSDKKSDGKLVYDSSVAKLEESFFNVPPVRMYIDSERHFIEQALVDFKDKKLGLNYNNSFICNGDLIKIFSSSDPDILVGSINFADTNDARKALEIVSESYNNGTWSNLKWPFRSAMLVKAATLMLAQRDQLASLIVYEAGKSISEALGDVDEAIDFLNFYARTESYLQRNYTDLTSRGPTLVISPWNFPLAIPCGMVVSSLVAGNTVILKSAEQTPLIAQKLVDLLHCAGIPQNVLIHLPGEGETVGDFLVKNENISTIVFTGSKAVGTSISAIARKRIYKNSLIGKSYPVKAITEMGGKNAIIVTQNAELDETVSGILYSAFGHAGQKCSACSRVIVHNSLKHKLMDRLKEACSDLKVGESYNFETTINPIISKHDQERLKISTKAAIEEAIQFNGSVVIDRSNVSTKAFCVGPVVIELPFSRGFDKDSFSQKELFGPVVHIIGFDTLDQAIELFNSTDYALTGGIFSQSQDDIDYLVSKLESGNIYINRSITGARVAVEPFGGFKLSGTGPKAGGKHYLLALHQIDNHEINKIISPEELNIEEGSDYILDLVKPSKLSATQRKERMEKFLNHLIYNFENHFKGFYGFQKDTLRDYKKWISKNYVSFVEKNHKNRTIPGQLSFDDYHMQAEHAAVISITDKPDLKTFIQVLSCILSGTGLIILSRNEKSFLWWKNIQDLLLKSGFSKENVDVFHANKENFTNILNSPKLMFVIFDGEIDHFENVIGRSLETKSIDLRVKQILTKSDNIKSNDFYHMHLQFTLVRSFAINTMRHGAPLDLEI